jgi:hypothetical protein
MTNISFFNVQSLYKSSVLSLYVSDLSISSVFTYYHAGLLVLSRGKPNLSIFRIVWLGHIYVRLYPLDTTLTPVIKQLISIYGVPPGWNTILSLLPENGVVNFQNFCSITFKMSDCLVSELRAAYESKFITRAFSEYKMELARDNIIFENYGHGMVNNSVSYLHFINVSDKGIMFYFDSGIVKITQSLMACILFGLQCLEDVDDMRIIFNSKYTSIITDSEYAIVVQTVLHTLFGSQSGFGRQVTQASSTGTSNAQVTRSQFHTENRSRVRSSLNGERGVSDVPGRSRSLSFRSISSTDISLLSDDEQISLLRLIFKLKMVK